MLEEKNGHPRGIHQIADFTLDEQQTFIEVAPDGCQ
jgi:hypothetical protein